VCRSVLLLLFVRSRQVLNSNINNPPNVNPTIISFARTAAAASGNVAYTGVGFQPSAVLFMARQDGSNTIKSLAIDNGTLVTDFSIAAANVFYSSEFDSISLSDDAGNFQVGHILSMDSDGFTIAWTKGGTGGASDKTIRALCFR